MMEIQEARLEQMDLVRELFQEYATELGVDLCFQGFSEELAGLPWLYARPRGFIYIARQENAVAGCIALKPLSEEVCEMKRLYVKPENRGRAIARALATKCLHEAAVIGYKRMNLDTLNTMLPAIELYKSLGFEECEAYYANPLPGVVYMSKQIIPSRA